MRTGIIGGTFDPVHNAHLMIAEKAYKEFKLDKVLFMPSPNPPHKDESEVTPVSHRINMIKLAVEEFDFFEFSDYELSQKGKVYSAETLTKYKEEFPEEELFFIIGSDSLYSIDSWYHPEVIFEKATILAARRDDSSGNSLESKIDFLREKYNASIYQIILQASDVSSTKIRNSGDKLMLQGSLPDSVLQYIIANKLYDENTGSNRMTNAEIVKDLKAILKPGRFKHTMAVADTAKKMAEALDENPNKAYLAGLLHDCAKCNTDEYNITICKKNNIDITDAEKENPFLLHAKVGAFLTEDKYGIRDRDIISSVRYHTTGCPDMSLLEKIIFTADYIEPNRTKQPNLELLREQAYIDIDYTVYLILRDTLEYLKAGRESFDPYTIEAYNYYKKLIEERI